MSYVGLDASLPTPATVSTIILTVSTEVNPLLALNLKTDKIEDDECACCGKAKGITKFFAITNEKGRQKHLQVLLHRFGGILVSSGYICRRCRCRLLFLERSIAAFRGKCQENARRKKRCVLTSARNPALSARNPAISASSATKIALRNKIRFSAGTKKLVTSHIPNVHRTSLDRSRCLAKPAKNSEISARKPAILTSSTTKSTIRNKKAYSCARKTLVMTDIPNLYRTSLEQPSATCTSITAKNSATSSRNSSISASFGTKNALRNKSGHYSGARKKRATTPMSRNLCEISLDEQRFVPIAPKPELSSAAEHTPAESKMTWTPVVLPPMESVMPPEVAIHMNSISLSKFPLVIDHAYIKKPFLSGTIASNQLIKIVSMDL